jgi:hypothetical protein
MDQRLVLGKSFIVAVFMADRILNRMRSGAALVASMASQLQSSWHVKIVYNYFIYRNAQRQCLELATK